MDSGRGPAVVKVICENTEVANPFCCGYIAASKSAVCSISGVVAQVYQLAFEHIAGYVKCLAVPAGGPV